MRTMDDLMLIKDNFVCSVHGNKAIVDNMGWTCANLGFGRGAGWSEASGDSDKKSRVCGAHQGPFLALKLPPRD